MRKRSEREIAIREAYIDGFRPFVRYSRGTYKGCYYHSQLYGYGVKTYNSKLVYDGQWKNSRFEGQGTLRRLDDDGYSRKLYVGQWSKGKRNGEGKMFHPNGVYYGYWKDNKRTGYGIMWYKDDRLYIGEWDNGKYHGAGVLMYPNGDRYEGLFQNGMKHGEGIYLHRRTGQVQKGMWHENFCKTSIMFDEFRHQVLWPTPYPIHKSELFNPDRLVKRLFQQYFPEPPQKPERLFCIDYIIQKRKKTMTI